jgi:hypothetical protein
MREACLALLLFACPEAPAGRMHVSDFGEAKIFVLSRLGDGSDFGSGSYGGLGIELVTNADWVRDPNGAEQWHRLVADQDAYKLALDTRGLNLFVHQGTEQDRWRDALAPGEWAQTFNFNKYSHAFHRDVYAFDRQFRFAAPSQTADGSNPPAQVPLVNRITAKGTLKAWAAYTDAGDGTNLTLVDGMNVAGVAPLEDGLTARVTLAAPIDGTTAVEAHYNHQGLANPYRLLVSSQATGSFVDVQHYDVAHGKLCDQRAADHGLTYLFVYGRQD